MEILYLSISLSIYLSIYRSIDLSIYLSIYLSISYSLFHSDLEKVHSEKCLSVNGENPTSMARPHVKDKTKNRKQLKYVENNYTCVKIRLVIIRY